MTTVKLNSTPALFAPVGVQDSYYDALMQDIYERPICAPFDLEKVRLSTSGSSTTYADYMRFVQEDVMPSVINVASRFYIGHMTGPVPPFLFHLNKELIRMNQNQVKIETSGIGSDMEREVLSWFHRIVFNSDSAFYDTYTHASITALGVFTSGGTLSNVTALQYALAKTLADDHAGVNEVGLLKALQEKGYTKVVIFASSLYHYSIKKAAKLMGIGKQAVISFYWDKANPNDSAADLRNAIEREQQQGALVLSLVGVAGTTESGEIDPLLELANIARITGVHFHVDAAYGGAFLLSSSAEALAGIEQADTVTICGHKQLYMPIGCSMVLFRSAEFASYSENNTNYQARKGGLDLGKFTLEGTRPFSAFLMHAAIRMHGERGYTEVLNTNLDLSHVYYNILNKSNFVDIYAKPELNILLYRFVPSELMNAAKTGSLDEQQASELNQLNKRLQQQQFAEGRYFVSFTKVFDLALGRDMVWLRSVFMNPFTSEKDMTEVFQDQERIFNLYLQESR